MNRKTEQQLLRAYADRLRLEEDTDGAAFYESARRASRRPQNRRADAGQCPDITDSKNGA